MKHWLLRLSVLTATLALAATANAQVNLSWTDCGSAGALDATFACNSNTGAPFTLVGSLIAPDAPRAVAMEFYLDMIEANPTQLPWWQLDTFEFPSPCRAGGVTPNADFTGGPFTCIDYWGGQASGGLGGVLHNFLGVGDNTQRFKGVFATAAEVPMTAGDELYCFKLNILRTKTTGAGSCAGCSDPACFVLNRITVNQPALVGDFNQTGPAPGGRDFCTWQGGAGANCATVPTQNRTWGQVKALYR